MNHFSIELSVIAVIPALILCGYVFYKDRIEREPIGLLAILFAAGAIGFVPAYFAQKGIISLIDSAFAKEYVFSPEGLISFASKTTEWTHSAICAFVGFSLAQIVIKWCLLYFITRKNKNFNYLFDGIVYSVFLSLGFAVAENISFVIQNDLELLGAKLITSIPCHLFIGILMGYYYTMWNARFTANTIESRMIEAGVVKEDNIRSSAPWLIISIFIPLLVNGIYVLAGSVKKDTITFVFYLIVFMLYGFSYIMVDQLADKDSSSARYISRMIAKGHPELSSDEVENIMKNGCAEQASENAEAEVEN